jgi:drug/metabolite transporter (DMT)-like permease
VFGKRGHPLTRWAVVGMIIGFAGTALMLIPKGGLRTSSLLAEIGALVACSAWALGTLYYRSIDTSLSSLMFMALQMCMGGLMLLTVAHRAWRSGALDVQRPGPDRARVPDLLQLVPGVYRLRLAEPHAPPALTGTYGYVNPAIAAYLGWQFLDEHLSNMQLLGMVTIILAVGILTLPGGTLTDPKTLEEPKTQ